jgi:hypothetical protein
MVDAVWVQKRQFVGRITGTLIGDGLRFLGVEEEGSGRATGTGLFLAGALLS